MFWGGSGTGLEGGEPPNCPGPMVVVTGGPPLTLLLTILMVLLVLGRPVVELVPEVTVLEELPLITVNENSGICIYPLDGSPPTTTVLDEVDGCGAVRMACGGGGAGLSGAGSMGGEGGGDGGITDGDDGGGSRGLAGCKGVGGDSG